MRCVEVNLADPRIHTIPLQLTFMLTNRCICKCIYCYADIKRKGINELSATKIIEVIKHADIIGVQNIHLTGGEIFLFKDWDKVLSVLSDLRYIPGVISTKYPLTPKDIRLLQNTGYEQPLQISLDTLSPDIINKQQGTGSNYLYNMLQRIKLLDYAALPYSIATVLTRFNCSVRNVISLYHFLATLKHLVRWDIRVAMESLYISKKEQKEMKASAKDIEEVYDYIESEIQPKAGFPVCLK